MFADFHDKLGENRKRQKRQMGQKGKISRKRDKDDPMAPVISH